MPPLRYFVSLDNPLEDLREFVFGELFVVSEERGRKSLFVVERRVVEIEQSVGGVDACECWIDDAERVLSSGESSG
jgi:hypothetical protein